MTFINIYDLQINKPIRLICFSSLLFSTILYFSLVSVSCWPFGSGALRESIITCLVDPLVSNLNKFCFVPAVRVQVWTIFFFHSYRNILFLRNLNAADAKVTKTAVVNSRRVRFGQRRSEWVFWVIAAAETPQHASSGPGGNSGTAGGPCCLWPPPSSQGCSSSWRWLV